MSARAYDSIVPVASAAECKNLPGQSKQFRSQFAVLQMDRRGRLMEKYVEKKKKQIERDELFRQIAALDTADSKSNTMNLLRGSRKKKKQRREARQFEDGLFDKEEAAKTIPAVPNVRSPPVPLRIPDTESVENGVGSEGEEAEDADGRTGGASEKVGADECDDAANINRGDNTSVGGEDAAVEPLGEESCGERPAHINYVPITGSRFDTFSQMLDGPGKNIASSSARDTLLSQRLTPVSVEGRMPEIQLARKRLGIFYSESEIISEIRANLTTIIQGDTGTGKSTQIPQFLYENGFAETGLIGMTQPRRLAAISIADRISKELNQEICSYKIKYENNLTEQTRIEVMTEGILFREIQADLLLEKFSVVILDEVHERSVFIDILIGFLVKAVKLRCERGNPLRLVLMSATMDVEDFRLVLGTFQPVYLADKHHKISVFYNDKTDEDYLNESFGKIMQILQNEKRQKKRKNREVEIPETIENDQSAAILVFLPTKKDIYCLKSRLEQLDHELVALPLHSGLSKAEQTKVYETYAARKIVMATNIAETSITINDVVFVIDTGRVKYCIRDENCVKYKIGWISKSSAKQRMGRAGRTGPGVCFRLYSSHTYESFRDKNLPQIYLEPLDSLILQLKATGIANISRFPFISPLPEEALADAQGSLLSIGALDSRGMLTSFGRMLARYPIRPLFARILCLKDTDEIFYCLAVIASMLSVGFEVIKTNNTAEYFSGEKSDLIAYLRIYFAYLNGSNKLAFLRRTGLSQQLLTEITRHTAYLLRMSGKVGVQEVLDITDENKDAICRVLYYTFSKQIAVWTGDHYVYQGTEIFVSRDSVEVAGEHLVFGHVVCGDRRDYVKNITIINPEWTGRCT